MVNMGKLVSTWLRALAVVLPLLLGVALISLVAELHVRQIPALSLLADPPRAAEFWFALARDMAPSFLAMLLAYWLAARFVRSLYGLDKPLQGFAFLWRWRFGMVRFQPYLVIQQGRVAEERDKEKVLQRVGGPGNLVIYQDSAAVLEQGGRITRVERSSFAPLDAFERVYATVDLRPIRKRHRVEGMTREGIRISCEVDISYQIRGANIAPAPDARTDREEQPSPYRMPGREVVKAATSTWQSEQRLGDSQGLTWEDLVTFPFADGILRRILARHSLDQLIRPGMPADDGDPRPRRAIRQELEQALSTAVQELGVEILSISLGDIVVQDEIARQWIASWKAEWENQMMQRCAEGDAECIALVETAQAQAQADVILELARGLQSLATDDQAVHSRLRLLRIVSLLRRVAYDPGTQSYLPADTMRTLSALQDLAEGTRSGG